MLLPSDLDVRLREDAVAKARAVLRVTVAVLAAFALIDTAMLHGDTRPPPTGARPQRGGLPHLWKWSDDKARYTCTRCLKECLSRHGSRAGCSPLPRKLVLLSREAARLGHEMWMSSVERRDDLVF